MVPPERRTKADIAAVALITIAVLVTSLLVWQHSDVRATVSQPSPAPVAHPPGPAIPPATLREAWRAPSPATPGPVVAGPAVISASGGDVVGRDPATGQVRWRYSRNLPLCTVGAAWDRAIAVYSKQTNCSEVTSLRGVNGLRGPQRNDDAEFGTRLLSDGTYVTATGNRVMDVWRSDLVQTTQYGLPVDLKNPENNLKRPGCAYTSTAVGESRVGMIEKCPGDIGDRVTVIRAKPQDEEKPEEVLSTVVGGHDASVAAVTASRVAVVLRDQGKLLIFNSTGALESQYPVRLPLPAPNQPPPPGGVRVEATTITSNAIYWYTGVDTVALSPLNLQPLWTAPDTLGPGVPFGGQLMLPVHDGIAVHDPRTGRQERVIPVDRGNYQGPVPLNAVGDVLLEQRGDTLVALR